MKRAALFCLLLSIACAQPSSTAQATAPQSAPAMTSALDLGSPGPPFKLVNTEDKRPARWVRNLASIELSSIP